MAWGKIRQERVTEIENYLDACFICDKDRTGGHYFK